MEISPYYQGLGIRKLTQNEINKTRICTRPADGTHCRDTGHIALGTAVPRH
jgi:hypothetical protein